MVFKGQQRFYFTAFFRLPFCAVSSKHLARLAFSWLYLTVDCSMEIAGEKSVENNKIIMHANFSGFQVKMQWIFA